MEKDIINKLVTKNLLDEEFAKLLVCGGWRPALLPKYIENVLILVLEHLSTDVDYFKVKKFVIVKMRELDPILFKKD